MATAARMSGIAESPTTSVIGVRRKWSPDLLTHSSPGGKAALEAGKAAIERGAREPRVTVRVPDHPRHVPVPAPVSNEQDAPERRIASCQQVLQDRSNQSEDNESDETSCVCANRRGDLRGPDARSDSRAQCNKRAENPRQQHVDFHSSEILRSNTSIYASASITRPRPTSRPVAVWGGVQSRFGRD